MAVNQYKLYREGHLKGQVVMVPCWEKNSFHNFNGFDIYKVDNHPCIGLVDNKDPYKLEQMSS